MESYKIQDLQNIEPLSRIAIHDHSSTESRFYHFKNLERYRIHYFLTFPCSIFFGVCLKQYKSLV